MRRALLVGIDHYKNHKYNLKGCVNDVHAMHDFLLQKAGFEEKEIKCVVNQQATRDELLKQLTWLVYDTRPGDKILFYYSGHGYRLPEIESGNEPDGFDEAICPHDFDWLRETHAIIDNEFSDIFSVVPKGVSFVWISDSCHSGDLSETGLKHQKTGFFSKSKIKSNNNVVLIAGSRSEQKSTFLYTDNAFHGVLTHFLLQVLNMPDGLTISLKEVMKRVKKLVKQGNYEQEPQLEGCTSLMKKSFLTLQESDYDD